MGSVVTGERRGSEPRVARTISVTEPWVLRLSNATVGRGSTDEFTIEQGGTSPCANCRTHSSARTQRMKSTSVVARWSNRLKSADVAQIF